MCSFAREVVGLCVSSFLCLLSFITLIVRELVWSFTSE